MDAISKKRGTSTLKSVLLVEDNAADASLFRIGVKRSGREVNLILARDGKEAMEILSEWENNFEGQCPQLVVLDLNMPRMDGREFLTQARSQDALRALPIVVFTSSAAPNDVNDCLTLGANAYIVKPVQFELFSERLKSILEFWLHTSVPIPVELNRVK